jgi:hypothetical protein
MDTLQQQLEQAEKEILIATNQGRYGEISELEQKRDAIKAEIAAIEEAEQNEAAQQVRIQTQVENKEGLALYVQELDMFEAFFPKKRYAEVMGLSEYEEKLQTFNQVLLQSFEQIEDQRNEKHNSDIAERDEKIVALKSAIKQNSEEYEKHVKQLDQLLSAKDSEIQQLLEDNIELSNENQSLVVREGQSQIDLKQANEKVEQLTAENEKLKEQLEASKALAPKPTASITDLLNQAKIKSAAEIALERTTPFRGPVVIGDVVAPPIALEEATFQPNQASDPVDELDETATPSIPADHQEVTTPNSFQEQGEVQTVPAPVASGTSSENGKAGEKTIEEAFRCIEELQGRVDHLYRVANISEVA